jgi:hypothetical protein
VARSARGKSCSAGGQSKLLNTSSTIGAFAPPIILSESNFGPAASDAIDSNTAVANTFLMLQL